MTLARDVDSPIQALEYMTECTLATIEQYATKKTRPQAEFNRQIAIAQNGIDWIKRMGHGYKVGGRVAECIASESVKTWAENIVKEFNK